MINLQKGQKIDLTKGNPSLKKVVVALGWSPQTKVGEQFDLDASVFMGNSNGKCMKDEDFIFYNNLKHSSEAVIHSGDDHTGDGEGDDEVITVDFSKMPINIEELDFIVTIHDAHNRRNQNFGQVNDAYVRVLDPEQNNIQLLKFDLGEDFSVETAVSVCKIYRKDGEWKFSAEGVGYAHGLDGFVRDHGLMA